MRSLSHASIVDASNVRCFGCGVGPREHGTIAAHAGDGIVADGMQDDRALDPTC